MKSPDLNPLKIGSRLAVIFVVLIAVILGGNGLLIWQFYAARLQTDRLIGMHLLCEHASEMIASKAAVSSLRPSPFGAPACAAHEEAQSRNAKSV